MRRVIFIFIYFSPNEQRAGGGEGGGDAGRLFFFFFPCSADHERDWPPCKVVFFGLTTNALNVRNNSVIPYTTYNVCIFMLSLELDIFLFSRPRIGLQPRILLGMVKNKVNSQNFSCTFSPGDKNNVYSPATNVSPYRVFQEAIKILYVQCRKFEKA